MSQGTVLVVDDDASVRKALRRLLRAAGYEVEVFADAASYLAHREPSPPACVVLDIRMPGTSGFDLQRAISGTGHGLPVVFITGHGGEDVRAQAFEAGAVDVLFKPIDEQALVAAIEKALASRRL
ncbi:MAG TPA: response regulator [Vicinamibacteria bacterium]|nr:response regulator [Vicinamibacteria bacterium]